MRPFTIRSTRRPCKKCGWYFKKNEGIGNICFECFLPDADDNDPFAFLPPVGPPATDKEIMLEKELTRTRQALYFLHTALEGVSGPLLPSPQQVISALAIFEQNYPEFR